jgi:hypothetical protein
LEKLVITNIANYVRVSPTAAESFSTKFSTWQIIFVIEFLLNQRCRLIKMRKLIPVKRFKNS